MKTETTNCWAPEVIYQAGNWKEFHFQNFPKYLLSVKKSWCNREVNMSLSHLCWNARNAYFTKDNYVYQFEHLTSFFLYCINLNIGKKDYILTLLPFYKTASPTRFKIVLVLLNFSTITEEKRSEVLPPPLPSTEPWGKTRCRLKDEEMMKEKLNGHPAI